MVDRLWTAYNGATVVGGGRTTVQQSMAVGGEPFTRRRKNKGLHVLIKNYNVEHVAKSGAFK
jgi:hypothetical protein